MALFDANSFSQGIPGWLSALLQDPNSLNAALMNPGGVTPSAGAAPQLPPPLPQPPPQVAPPIMSPPQMPQQPRAMSQVIAPPPEPGFGDRLSAGVNNLNSGGNPLAMLFNVAQGFATGQRTDKHGITQQMMLAQANALIERGVDPRQAMLMVTNPKAMEAGLPSVFPKYDHVQADGYGRAFDPARGTAQHIYTNPQMKTVGDNLVEAMPGAPSYVGGPQPLLPQPAPLAPGQRPWPQAGPQAPPGARTVFDAGPKEADVASFRKELTTLPSIKRHQEAAPIYNSMVKSFHTKSRASDLDFVYGMAKIFDPDSVVREGEMVIVQKAQGLPDRLVGAINAMAQGQGLQPDLRRELLEVAKTRMDQYGAQASADAKHFGDIATRRRMNPADVLPSITPLLEHSETPPAPPVVPTRANPFPQIPPRGR